MRDEFWNLLVVMRYNRYYVQYWKRFYSALHWITTAAQIILSVRAVGDLVVLKTGSETWAWILLATACWQAISHLIPWEKRSTLLSYAAKKYLTLCVNMEDTWNRLAEMPQEDVIDAIANYRKQAAQIEIDYYGDFDSIEFGLLRRKAENKAKAYIQSMYNTKPNATNE